jgi:hypothetical protein
LTELKLYSKIYYINYQDPNSSNEETDLIGFDNLWQVDYQDAKNFVSAKLINKEEASRTEIKLLSKELEDSTFKQQKLEWQLSEREKELKNLYSEVHMLLELNKKLTQQLTDYQLLCEKQERIIEIFNSDPYKKQEPKLPIFKKN